MSTNALIGKVNKNGNVTVIYNHYDGYLDGVGKMLVQHYNDEATIDELLKLGDISELGSIPESDPLLWKYDDNADPDKCRTYKGRGDTGVDARTYPNAKAAIQNEGHEYNYFWIDGTWYCYLPWGPSGSKLIFAETGESVTRDNLSEL